MSGSGSPLHSSSQLLGAVNVTRLPRLGPLHNSPIQASGFSTAPQPGRRCSSRSRLPVFCAIASISSSRSSTRPTRTFAHCFREALELGAADPEASLPPRPLPRPQRAQKRQVRAGLTGIEKVERPPHCPGPHQGTAPKGAPDSSRWVWLAPQCDRKLGRRGHLGLNATERADRVHDPEPADRIEQLPAHAPGEQCGPAEARRNRARSAHAG